MSERLDIDILAASSFVSHLLLATRLFVGESLMRCCDVFAERLPLSALLFNDDKGDELALSEIGICKAPEKVIFKFILLFFILKGNRWPKPSRAQDDLG